MPGITDRGRVGAKLVLKILTGCFFALVAVIAIVGSVIISNVERLQPYLVHIVIGFAAAGLLLILLGRLKVKPLTAPGAQADPRHVLIDPDRPLAFFGRLDFWGGVLVVSTLPIFLLSTSQIRAKAHSHPAPPPPVKVVVPPVQFPPMEITGLVWNGEKSTAVINGRTLQVGDMFEGVKVVGFTSNAVTVELNGATKTLQLE